MCGRQGETAGDSRRQPETGGRQGETARGVPEAGTHRVQAAGRCPVPWPDGRPAQRAAWIPGLTAGRAGCTGRLRRAGAAARRSAAEVVPPQRVQHIARTCERPGRGPGQGGTTEGSAGVRCRAGLAPTRGRPRAWAGRCGYRIAAGTPLAVWWAVWWVVSCRLPVLCQAGPAGSGVGQGLVPCRRRPAGDEPRPYAAPVP